MLQSLRKQNQLLQNKLEKARLNLETSKLKPPPAEEYIDDDEDDEENKGKVPVDSLEQEEFSTSKNNRSIRKVEQWNLLPEENSDNSRNMPVKTQFKSYSSARKPTDQHFMMELDRALNENGSLSNGTVMILKELLNRNSA